MAIRVGTFEFDVPEWGTVFYQPDIDENYDAMLKYYADRFSTVEYPADVLECPDIVDSLLKNCANNSAFKYVFTFPMLHMTPRMPLNTPAHTIPVPTKSIAAKSIPAKSIPTKVIPSKSIAAKSIPATAIATKSIPTKAIATPSRPGMTVVSIDRDMRDELFPAIRHFHQINRLGCVSFSYPAHYGFSPERFKLFIDDTKDLPHDLPFVFEFMHPSWTNPQIIGMVRRHKNWSIAISCVQNSFSDAHWACTMPSTKIGAKPQNNYLWKQLDVLATVTPIKYIRFYGSLGEDHGSYDRYRFLERLTSLVTDLAATGSDVYCLFGNMEGTVTRPFPPRIIEGEFINPLLCKLPFYAEIDRPSCLHDGLRLQDLIKKARYDTDEQGYVKCELIV